MPVYAHDEARQSEYSCLMEAVYFEAGNQPFVGKIAVACLLYTSDAADE